MFRKHFRKAFQRSYEERALYGTVYTVDDILDIHKCLMKKFEIVKNAWTY